MVNDKSIFSKYTMFVKNIYIILLFFLLDLEGSRSPSIKDKLEQFYIRRLESLKFWLLHAIGSIHTYLSGQVLQSLGFILEKVLVQADSLDTIISGNIIFQCVYFIVQFTITKCKIFSREFYRNNFFTSDYFAVHNEYLNKVHEHCLLTDEFKDLMTTINNVCKAF